MSVCYFVKGMYAENVHIVLCCQLELCVLICFLNAGSHLCFVFMTVRLQIDVYKVNVAAVYPPLFAHVIIFLDYVLFSPLQANIA